MLDSALIAADAARLARLALAEDGERDITTEITVTGGEPAAAAIEFRTGGVMAGEVYARAVAEQCGCRLTWSVADGVRVAPGSDAGMLRGPLAAILRAERPLLNLLQRACGIAGATRAYVDAVADTGARILHTRKTAPGLRLLDVSAALAGGAALHRLDLSTTVMVKDNHWQALHREGRTLAAALEEARRRGIRSLQVEVESEAQVREACDAGATRLLIDNQTPETVRTWAEIAREQRSVIEIEATGGITLENVRGYAEVGADFISVGALTHSVRAADLGLEVRRDT